MYHSKWCNFEKMSCFMTQLFRGAVATCMRCAIVYFCINIGVTRFYSAILTDTKHALNVILILF